MMKLNLAKLHNAGNSFIVGLLDEQRLTRTDIAGICDPRFGLGGDGFVLVSRSDDGNNYRLRFFNSDGSRFRMCFNGTLCAALFLQQLGHKEMLTLSVPGMGAIAASVARSTVSLRFEAPRVRPLAAALPAGIKGRCYALPFADNHKVLHTERRVLQSPDFITMANSLRAPDELFAEGANVHFIAQEGSTVYIRHFEKGLERETLSCGSGCVSAALVLDGERNLSFVSACGRLRIRKQSSGLWSLSAQPAVIGWVSVAENKLRSVRRPEYIL